ncbi:dTDP-glucose 4,6-dehydratase [Actinomadura sp. LD22]|uniref:dTDP-glucose 4,6-dehydratase n=1 Tax=Actinomadura physcomitrii TaxID=2650748 RepID=A0A6I4MN52_9ACTN|nr:dTDP-glucose 4,6-dehydratase [Actinomadura physcomitrii]MWA03676.1 dTDP-glucose 4,6-dehydratase [Actinomadura physcomitrii]
MRVLVTGGAGFIGSHYVRTMLAGGYAGFEDAEITVVDLLTYSGRTANLPGGDARMRLVRGDICDQAMLRETMRGHDAVVHFAAESHVDRSLVGAADFMRTNVLGTQSVLDAALRTGIETVVHVSTDEVYGSIETGQWTEEWPLEPNSPYASSKASSDLVARSYWRTHGLDVRVTRCSNNYGPYQHIEKLIPRFVTNLLSGGTVPLYGDGTNVREWIHVDDHCRALQLVLTRGRAGQVYNVGGGTALSNREMTGLLLELCDAGWERVEHVEDRKGHDLRYAIDDSKIRRELGYAPAMDFATGLARTVEWYRSNPAWWKPLRNE